MIKRYENQQLRFYDYESGRVFEDLEFERCSFASSTIVSLDIHRRPTVRNVSFRKCEAATSCMLTGIIVEDVLAEGLKTLGVLHTWGCVFKHVTLRGRIGAIMLSGDVIIGPTLSADIAKQRAFELENVRYYSSLDWALDMREAEFSEDIDIRCIPARLIRRDPETQVVVTRAKAAEGEWRKLDLSRTYWKTAIEFMLNDPRQQDTVLVAPKRNRRYRDLLQGLLLLREAGIAEPD
jgi:hypothetical protein